MLICTSLCVAFPCHLCVILHSWAGYCGLSAALRADLLLPGAPVPGTSGDCGSGSESQPGHPPCTLTYQPSGIPHPPPPETCILRTGPGRRIPLLGHAVHCPWAQRHSHEEMRACFVAQGTPVRFQRARAVARALQKVLQLIVLFVFVVLFLAKRGPAALTEFVFLPALPAYPEVMFTRDAIHSDFRTSCVQLV